MSIRNRTQARPTSLRLGSALLAGVLALALTACNEPGSGDGVVVNTIVLPTDTLVNLACADVGINFEQCILEDPENPFVNTPIIEFDENFPDAFNKLELAAAIPAGPTGAKARYYFWGTALARRQSAENQYFTALALHELWDLNSDPIIQNQALRAYRSVLDNFFGGVLVFEEPFGPGGELVTFPDSVGLNERVADNLYRTDATGFARLVPDPPLLVLELLLGWGFRYTPANPPLFEDGVVSVINF
jgi:hypothetical protein